MYQDLNAILLTGRFIHKPLMQLEMKWHIKNKRNSVFKILIRKMVISVRSDREVSAFLKSFVTLLLMKSTLQLV